MNTNTQEQPQEKIRSIPSVDLTHRLNLSPFVDEPYSASDLCDSINPMTSRAESVLDCLSELVDAGRLDSMTDSALQNLIQTVINEIRDIDETVNAFNAFTHAEKKKVQA